MAQLITTKDTKTSHKGGSVRFKSGTNYVKEKMISIIIDTAENQQSRITLYGNEIDELLEFISKADYFNRKS